MVFEENVQSVRYRSKTRSKTWNYCTLPCWFDSSNHPNSFWEPFAQYISSLHNLPYIASVGCQIQIPKSKYFSLKFLPSFEQLQLPEVGFDPSPIPSILSLRHKSEGFKQVNFVIWGLVLGMGFGLQQLTGPALETRKIKARMYILFIRSRLTLSAIFHQFNVLRAHPGLLLYKIFTKMAKAQNFAKDNFGHEWGPSQWFYIIFALKRLPQKTWLQCPGWSTCKNLISKTQIIVRTRKESIRMSFMLFFMFNWHPVKDIENASNITRWIKWIIELLHLFLIVDTLKFHTTVLLLTLTQYILNMEIIIPGIRLGHAN